MDVERHRIAEKELVSWHKQFYGIFHTRDMSKHNMITIRIVDPNKSCQKTMNHERFCTTRTLSALFDKLKTLVRLEVLSIFFQDVHRRSFFEEKIG